jgi:hypothetical protein
MPNVNNHSEKFKKAQQNFTRLESIRSDVNDLEEVCQESLSAHHSKELTKKRKKELIVLSKMAKTRIIEKVDAIQSELGVVAGTGDMAWVNAKLNRTCDVNMDGTFNTSSLFSEPQSSENSTITPSPHNTHQQNWRPKRKKAWHGKPIGTLHN